MEQDLSNYRKSYEKDELLEDEAVENPIEFFRDWFFEADNHENISEANAMTVSTLGLDGFPNSRIVLLKKFNEDGFTFYTNYNSDKGKAIENDNHVCLSFFWPYLERQVIIKGYAKKIAENLSEGYFYSRPTQSQYSAMVSPQSDVVPNREYLEKKIKNLEEKKIKPSRPDHWGGYCVFPKSIEFWQGRPNRLHDRLRYTLQEDFNWKIERLAP